MSGRNHDLVGRPVTEEEVAKDLGFSSVYDLRRWDTEQGRAVSELEQKLRAAKNDADGFQWHVKRMCLVFERLKAHLPDTPENAEMRLAIGVVLGKEVDWDKKLEWLSPAACRST